MSDVPSNSFSAAPVTENPVVENPAIGRIVNEWLSVEAAALRLGISSRSIARRIQSGQLESRVDENGRRSVLVTVPAPVAQPATPAPVAETALDNSQAKELAQQAMTVVIRTHEESVSVSRAEVFAARRSAVRGWAAAAILLVGSSVTVGIVTHHLTQAADLVHQAESRIAQSDQKLSQVTTERDSLRQALVDAKVQGAETQGKLSAIQASYTTKAPTTAPSSAIQRVASALLGD